MPAGTQPLPEEPSTDHADDENVGQALFDGSRLIARLEGAIAPAEVDAETELVLSRFAWLRREEDTIVVESARARGRVVFADPRAQAYLMRFATPVRPSHVEELPPDVAAALVAMLKTCEVLLTTDVAAREDEAPLALWEFHDLLFHTRSRSGRTLAPLGGTYRFVGRIDQAPALPPVRWPQALQLRRPDFSRLQREDPPLSAVQAARRSIRQYAERPIDAHELAEFLYRVGRVDDVTPGADPSEPLGIARPYASGGSIYELELYVGIGRCTDIDPGLYHYDSSEHALALVSADQDAVSELLAQEGRGAMLPPAEIQVLVLIAARMHRIAWKYQSLAYSLVLKHAGVVIDQMYLAAAAMRLAPCAIGSGNSDLFTTVSGLDYYEQSLVAEFALGRPEGG